MSARSEPRALAEPSEPLLSVRSLCVDFASADGWLRAVEDVSFDVAPGEVLGVVGESGSGKSVSSLAVLDLLPHRASRVSAESIRFDGRELTQLSAEEMRRIRGGEISMIFQEPMTSLNPAYTVGNQIAETVRVHWGASRKHAWRHAVEMLDRVGIPDPHRRVKDYPHAFSGGMRQRAMIAMALSCGPKLLIADEPTTALDVTIQAQILELIRGLQSEFGMAVVFVTHDLGVVADICNRVVVMYAGQVVEHSNVADVYIRPSHPYTEGLLESMPQVAELGKPLTVIPGQVPRPQDFATGCRFGPRCKYESEACAQPVSLLESPSGMSRCVKVKDLELSGTRWRAVTGSTTAPSENGRADTHDPLLRVRGLAKEFPVQSSVLRRVVGRVRAVDGVDFEVAPGETLGLVGESGSGKSTVARLLLRLLEPTRGTIEFDGTDITTLSRRDLRKFRRNMQIVFQDPYSSLDPRSTIAETVGEPLEVHLGMKGAPRDERVAMLLERVGLGRHLLRRFPHEFSGGQRQRIAIARALALDPRLVICDEPVSSLDVSTQSQVINLLKELQSELELAYVFIAHDLSVVRHISDRIGVMYLGRIVEIGDAEQVYTRARHPYTAALLSAIPVPDHVAQRQRERIVLEGDVPSPLNPPSGCRFHTRCPYAMEICAVEDPPASSAPGGTTVYCHLHTSGPRLAGAPLAEYAGATI
ncbi:MAG: oligopeptide/dipeptide transporter, ATPase subunit [Actinomycetia bacterium]|nr:oligopeptide/dipeptide transporter, ATPase subunit [Actinomycetes bacterium]